MTGNLNSNYDENFNPATNRYRRIYHLDQQLLFFLSEFADEHRKVIEYSVDVEKACDSHYVIDENNAAKLAHRLGCANNTDELFTALSAFFSEKTESAFVRMLENAHINHQPCHFDNYD